MSAPPEPDIQPSFDWNGPSVYHSIFYVVFMVVSHGTLQLFVGVIIEKFKQRAGITTMTTGQRQYADLLRQLAEIKPTPKAQAPNNRIGHWCHNLVVSKRGLFNKFMMSVVILNICKCLPSNTLVIFYIHCHDDDTGVICTEFQNQPEWLTTTQGRYTISFYGCSFLIRYCRLLLFGVHYPLHIRIHRQIHRPGLEKGIYSLFTSCVSNNN